jgi:hypothetical protein
VRLYLVEVTFSRGFKSYSAHHSFGGLAQNALRAIRAAIELELELSGFADPAHKILKIER